jgi:hypothetical protein
MILNKTVYRLLETVNVKLQVELTKSQDHKELVLMLVPIKVPWDRDHSQYVLMPLIGHNTKVVSLATVVNPPTIVLPPLVMMDPTTGSSRTHGVPVGVKRVTLDLHQEIPVTY